MRILASSEAGGIPTSCPNCYELFDYGSAEARQLPRILRCGHLVCSACAEELWCEGEICCPTCCELDGCETASSLPIAPASPLPSPQTSPFRTERKKGVTFDTSPPSPGGQGSKLTEFVSATPAGSIAPAAVNSAAAAAATAAGLVPEQLVCLVDGCVTQRLDGRYFCLAHADKATRVSAKATKQMVMHYSRVSNYSISTSGLGLTLTDQLSQPTLESLSPASLRDVFEEQGTITLGEALFIIDCAIDILQKQPNQLSLDAPLTIVGDIHGQFFDLVSMLDEQGHPHEKLGQGGGGGGRSPSYLFLGDYVDRGAFGCEVLLYLLSLKLHCPDNVHLIRGNHECRSLTTHFGFKDECKLKYGLPVYYRFVKCFEMMPVCAVVTNQHGKYFCTHGGISPSLTDLTQVEALNRAVEPQMEGLLCDLLWADPADDPSNCPDPMSATDAELDVILDSDFQPNPLRGCSVSFGCSAAERFLKANDLLCVIRAHAVQEMGYYRHFEAALRLRRGEDACPGLPPVITVFSAPNYCDRYGNSGAVLRLTQEDLEPEVCNYSCVPHPSPVDQPNRAELHFSALIEACPYMPSTFRDFVKMASRLGPAQPLFREDDEVDEPGSPTSMTAPLTPEASPALFASAGDGEEGDPQVNSGGGLWAARRMTVHDKYEAEAANDRINELHPVVVRKRLQGAGDEDAVIMGSSSNLTQQVEGVNSGVRYNIRVIREAYEASCRASQETPTSAAMRPTSGSNAVQELRKLWDKGAADRRGSGGDKPHWQRRRNPAEMASEAAFEAAQKRVNFETKARTASSKAIAEGKASPMASSIQAGGDPNKPPPAGRFYAGRRDSGDVRALSDVGERWLKQVHPPHDDGGSSEAGPPKPDTSATSSPRHTRSKSSKIAELYLHAISPKHASVGQDEDDNDDRDEDEQSSRVFSDTMSTPAHSVRGSAEDALFAQLQSDTAGDDGTSSSVGDTERQSERLPPSKRNSLERTSVLDNDCMFSHAEILGLKLMFALMDHSGTEYIDASALEMYAGEQNDYAQQKEVQACIEAVDLDGDGRIGIMDFISFAARAKFFWSSSQDQESLP
jgi:diadenosine tetraphosphatase ApaH/serine/threonine PP2A family protein phosphatase